MSEFSSAAPWGEMKRCILNLNGSNAGYLDANNSNNWSNGSLVDWAAVESSGQNVMVEIPKFYFSKKFVGDERIFGVSDEIVETNKVTMDDWKIHPAFYRDRDNLCDNQTGTAAEVDFRYMSAFKGWVDGSGRLRSLPNKQPTVSKNISQFRTHAKNMGVGYSQFDFNLLFAIQMLYITEYGHGDSQTAIGRGYVDGNPGATVTGGTLQYGNNTFGETTGKQQMSYRGIEDLWGNIRTWTDGLYYDPSFNILIGNKGFNDTGIGYKNTGKGASINGNIRDIQMSEDAGFITSKTAGNYDTDGLYDYGNLSAGLVACAGGSWTHASHAGALCLYSYAASGSTANVGSLLCF